MIITCFPQIRMLVLPMAFPSRGTSFVGHVLHVISMGAEKMVQRVAADPIIASMANEQAVGDGANSEFISSTVGGCKFAARTITAVARTSDGALPWPARSRAAACIDPQPKVFRRHTTHFVVAGTRTVVRWLTPHAHKYLAAYRASAFCFGTRGYTFAQGWYTSHVDCLLTRRLANPRTFAASLGFSMPNYSTYGGTK